MQGTGDLKRNEFLWEITVSFIFHFSLRNQEKFRNNRLKVEWMNNPRKVWFFKMKCLWQSVQNIHLEGMGAGAWRRDDALSPRAPAVSTSRLCIYCLKDGRIPEGRGFCLFCSLIQAKSLKQYVLNKRAKNIWWKNRPGAVTSPLFLYFFICKIRLIKVTT